MDNPVGHGDGLPERQERWAERFVYRSKKHLWPWEYLQENINLGKKMKIMNILFLYCLKISAGKSWIIRFNTHFMSVSQKGAGFTRRIRYFSWNIHSPSFKSIKNVAALQKCCSFHPSERFVSSGFTLPFSPLDPSHSPAVPVSTLASGNLQRVGWPSVLVPWRLALKTNRCSK